MRKIQIALGIVSSLLIILSAPYVEAGPGKKIGIILFSQEERYNAAAQGMMDAMKEAGFVQPGVTFIKENANGNRARAAELVDKLKAEHMNLIFTVGTSATIAVAREIKDVPIVFSMVYDPIQSGIVKEWGSSHNNTTGVSTYIPMIGLLEKLAAFRSVKRLAVLYSPGEKNSEQQLRDLQEAAGSIVIVPVPFTKRESISRILPEVVRTSDAIFVTGSNLVDSDVSLIVQTATAAKVITITHLKDLVQKGVLLGLCPDPYRIGHMAGQKVVKILKGATPSSLPIEKLKVYDLVVNEETARKGHFQIPSDLLKQEKNKQD